MNCIGISCTVYFRLIVSLGDNRSEKNSSERAFGVVVSRFLRMEKAASSIPATSIFRVAFYNQLKNGGHEMSGVALQQNRA